MMMCKRFVLSALLVGILGAGAARAAEPKPILPGEFNQLHQMIRPQDGESLFWQVPWLLNLDEAMLRGAAEGRPVFVWSGAGGAPHTVC